MKNVLVTGATGFIGNYVIEELLKKGVDITASSLNEKKAVQQPWFNKVTYIPYDFSQFNPQTDYFKFFRKPDLLIHLAWEGLPNYKSPHHLEINFPRHLNLLTNLIRNGLNDVTVTGTCFEYGMQEGCLTETMPVHPSNAYAIAKNQLRIELQELQQQHFFSLKWVRLFYIYGKGQNPNSLLSQLEEALEKKETVFNMSGGEQVRDYLPIEKVAKYIVIIALQNKLQGVVNCCSGKPVTIKEFVENYLKATNQTIKLNLGYYPYADYEPMRFWGCSDKLNLIVDDENAI